jgi:hypothetical protein
MQSSEVFTVGPWQMGLRKFLQSIDQLYCKWSKLSWTIQCLCWLQSLKASIRSVCAIYTYPTICTWLMLKSILLFTYSQGKDIMSFSFINCQMLKQGLANNMFGVLEALTIPSYVSPFHALGLDDLVVHSFSLPSRAHCSWRQDTLDIFH